MRTRNYFKVFRRGWGAPKLFFFDDRDYADTSRAYGFACEEAHRSSGQLSAFREPRVIGAWSQVDLIGEERRAA